VRLSKLVERKNEITHEHREYQAKGRRDYNITGYGCPLARRGHDIKRSGIENLSQAFLHVYKSL